MPRPLRREGLQVKRRPGRALYGTRRRELLRKFPLFFTKYPGVAGNRPCAAPPSTETARTTPLHGIPPETTVPVHPLSSRSGRLPQDTAAGGGKRSPPCLHPPRKALPLIRSARQHPLPRRPLPEKALSHRLAPATHDAQAGRSSAPLPVQDGQEKRIPSEEHLSRPGRPAARSPERKHSLRPSCSSSPALHPKGSLPCPATAKRQAAAGGGARRFPAGTPSSPVFAARPHAAGYGGRRWKTLPRCLHPPRKARARPMTGPPAP